MISPGEEVKQVADQIYKRIFNYQHTLCDNLDNEVTRAALKLHDMVKCGMDFQECIERLERTVASTPLDLREHILNVYWSNLLIKVAPRASWRCYGNILVSIELVRTVSQKFNIEMEHSLKSSYTNYIVIHFTEFITSMGGFSDLPQYINYQNGRLGIHIILGLVWCVAKLATYL